MRTILFAPQKGGCGKSTLAASLAVAAQEAGERVVVLAVRSIIESVRRRAAGVLDAIRLTLDGEASRTLRKPPCHMGR